MKKKRRIILIGMILTVLIIFGTYVSDYYHADAGAKEALLTDENVEVTKMDYGWFFDGPSEDQTLVFYPGAKVETTAYAPLLHRLSAQGVDVCLVDMPFHLAFFGMRKAGSIIDENTGRHWYIGGHSLGGAMAASWAADHGDRIDGVVLLAAYPTKQLDADLKEILVYGSEDGVLNLEKVREGEQYAPEDYEANVIAGGNHAQFENYGLQYGDGTANITREEQQTETIERITQSLLP